MKGFWIARAVGMAGSAAGGGARWGFESPLDGAATDFAGILVTRGAGALSIGAKGSGEHLWGKC